MSVPAKPALPGELARLGEIMQLSFMSHDFDAALAFWTGTMGAGPFYVADKILTETLLYRGEPSDIDFGVAIGYWGDIQIELIKQRNDAPSIYREWRDAGREGLHHVCVMVEDFDNARAVCERVGAVIAQEGSQRAGLGRFLYADPGVGPGGGPGMFLEVLEATPSIVEMNAMLQAAHRTWDGSDPVRSFASPTA